MPRSPRRPRSRSVRTSLVVLTALAAASMGLVAPGAATGTTGTTGTTGPAAADEPGEAGRLVLVLDSSGSMAERAPGGGTKIQAAKQALGEVVDQLPDEAEVGVRVFGATVFSRDEPGACTDTQSVVPVGPLDRDALRAAVADYTPYGETPIGNALRGAAADLGASGQRTVVLLSDGEPTCAPDPCAVARELRRGDVEVRINVVGLDVAGEARRALRCVARAGGGTYVDATSADDLVTGLVKVSVRDLRGFALDGQRVSGGASPAAALPLEPGTYVDSARPGQPRHYLVDKPAGGGVSVASLVRPPDREDNWHVVNRVSLETLDGERCADGLDQAFQIVGLTPLSATAARFDQFTRGYAAEECAAAERLVAVVELDNRADFRLEVETTPAVEAPEALPPPVEDWDGPWVRPVRLPRGGPATPVAGGVTPDAAPVLEPGTTYTDTLLASEQLVYEVPVDYGQAVRVVARLEPDAAAAEALGIQGNPVTLRPLNATGAVGDQLFDNAQDLDGGGFYDGEEPRVLTAAVPPVRVRNSESSSDLLATHTRSGAVHVVLGMGLLDSDRPDEFAAPVTLRVEVDGEPEGEPTYVEGVPEDGATAAGDASPGAGADPAEDTGDAASAGREADAGLGGLATALVAGGGLLAAAAVVAALVLLRRRRA